MERYINVNKIITDFVINPKDCLCKLYDELRRIHNVLLVAAASNNEEFLELIRNVMTSSLAVITSDALNIRREELNKKDFFM